MRPMQRMMAFLRARVCERAALGSVSGTYSPPLALVVAGAEQAGTAMLFRQLAAHPALHVHRTDEMTYFTSASEHGRGYLRAVRHHYGVVPGDVLLVARCDAMLDSPVALDRLAEHNPGVHVAVMLRDPVERAWAAYWHARRTRREPLPRFETAIAAEELGHGERRYLGRGKYSRQLAHLFGRFPARQVHVFIAEDTVHDLGGACERLWSVFEAGRPVRTRVPTAGQRLCNVLCQALARLSGRGRSSSHLPTMAVPLRRRLVAYYEPYNQELEHMLGRNLDAWRR
ncbi:MAG: hypothetical protein WDA11_06335 [Thiohalomonadaceae bacterium]